MPTDLLTAGTTVWWNSACPPVSSFQTAMPPPSAIVVLRHCTAEVKWQWDLRQQLMSPVVSAYCCVTCCWPTTSRTPVHFCVSCLVLTDVPVDSNFSISHLLVCLYGWNSWADLRDRVLATVVLLPMPRRNILGMRFYELISLCSCWSPPAHHMSTSCVCIFCHI